MAMKHFDIASMSDYAFLSAVGSSRQVCQEFMLATRMSPLPDRAMHARARISGGDLPVGGVGNWLSTDMSTVKGWVSSATTSAASGVCK